MIRKFFLSVLFLTCLVINAEELPVLRITFPGTNLNNVDYIKGLMILTDIDGSSVTLNASFRTRGATALSYTMKPAFNMKLEDESGEELDYSLLNLRKASTFILDAMAIDRICMRNRVCFDIWNAFSRLPYESDFGSRNGTVGKFVILYMNDEYKGIYCMTDKVNRKLLNLKKPKVEPTGDVTIRGVLYKRGTTDIGNQNDEGYFNDSTVYVARYHDAWELKEPDDYPGLEAWKPLADYYDTPVTTENTLSQFYRENLIDYSLFVMAFSIEDNWGYKNMYFSMVNCQGDENDRKFIVTPWDLDTSLGGAYDGACFNGNYSDWSMNDIAKSAIAPFSVCFSDSETRQAMKDRWLELRKSSLSVDSVASRLNNYCDLFEKSGAWNEYVKYWNSKSAKPCYVENLSNEVSQIIEWYANRFDSMDEYFGIDKSLLPSYHTSGIKYDSGSIYNLQGMKVDVDKLVSGQIYVRNGVKFLYRE